MLKTNTESEKKVKTEVKLKKKVKTTEKLSTVEEPIVPETVQVQEPVVQEPVVVQESVAVQESEVVEQTVTIDESTQNLNEVQQEESNTEILFNKLINQFQDIQIVMKTLHSNLKILQKEVLKEKKESKKKESKNKKKNGKKRSPSGFAKPAQISDELAKFLDLSSGTELARTEVTSKVIAYIKEHDLQNPSNKKQILLDDNLNKLLVPGSEDIVTFFNLQTYLKKHFAVHQSTVVNIVPVVETTVV